MKKNSALPYHPGKIIWLEPFKQMGIETHQGIKIPYIYGIPGQLLKCRFIKTAMNRYELNQLKFTSKPDFFNKPECKHFTKCGGCQWLHVQHDNTLTWKNERVNYLVNKNKISDFTLLPIEGNENPYHTRYKAIFPVQQNPDLKIGLYKSNSHNIVHIEKCLMLQPEFNLLLNIIHSWMIENNISGYNEQSGNGLIRYFLMQKSVTDNSIALTLIASDYDIPKQQKLIDKIGKLGINLCGINIMKNKFPGNKIITSDLKCVYGSPYIVERIFNINIKLYPTSFFQINIPMAIKLFSELKIQIQELNISNLIEFYAGTGIIGLLLSRIVNSISAYEFNEEAVQSGKKAAKDNNIKNFNIFQRNLEDDEFLNDFKSISNNNERYAIIADPPRKGLSSNIHRLLKTGNTNYFIYISCNPDTFFKDAIQLSDIGLKLNWLKPFDFFPFTPHIELLGVFQKNY